VFSLLIAWIAPPQGGDSNPIVVMMPLFIILIIFYFLMIRPQMKRQKQQRSMLDTLKKGDNVVAAGGVCGTIAGLKDKDDTIILKVDDNVKIEVLKSSVSTVLEKKE